MKIPPPHFTGTLRCDETMVIVHKNLPFLEALRQTVQEGVKDGVIVEYQAVKLPPDGVTEDRVTFKVRDEAGHEQAVADLQLPNHDVLLWFHNREVLKRIALIGNSLRVPRQAKVHLDRARL